MNDDDFVRTLLARAAGDPEPGDLVQPALRGARRRRTARVVGLTVAVGLTAGSIDAGVGLAGGSSRPATISVEAPSPSATPADGTLIPPTRRAAPLTLRATSIAGHPVNLEALRGRVVVIVAFGSWCSPCRVQVAAAASLDTPVVGLAELDTASRLRPFLAAEHATFPVINDPHGRVVASLPPGSDVFLPTTLVLDRRGRLATRLIGTESLNRLAPLIAALERE